MSHSTPRQELTWSPGEASRAHFTAFLRHGLPHAEAEVDLALCGFAATGIFVILHEVFTEDTDDLKYRHKKIVRDQVGEREPRKSS